jgi:hypothetical protein
MVPARRLVLALILATAAAAAGCGTRNVLGTPAGEGGGGGEAAAPGAPSAARRLAHVSIDLLPVDRPPRRTRVHVVVTDETGAARPREVGVFDGECADVSVIARTERLRPLLGADCGAGGTRVLLRLVARDSSLILLRAVVTGDPSEEPEFDQLARIDLPSGTRVLTDLD